MQTVKIIIEDGRIEQFNEEVMKEFDNFIGRSDIINSNFIKNFIAQKLTAHKELILKMVDEKADSMFKNMPMPKLGGDNRDCDKSTSYNEALLDLRDYIKTLK